MSPLNADPCFVILEKRGNTVEEMIAQLQTFDPHGEIVPIFSSQGDIGLLITTKKDDISELIETIEAPWAALTR